MRACFSGLPKSSGNLIQLPMYGIALGAFLFGWQHDVRYLHRWHLTCQSLHLVHGNAGSDRCITQSWPCQSSLTCVQCLRLPHRRGWTPGVFSFCYAFCLAFSDAHDGMIAHAVASRDAINTSVWLGEFSRDSAVGFGARPEREFARVASLPAFWSEESVVFS